MKFFYPLLQEEICAQGIRGTHMLLWQDCLQVSSELMPSTSPGFPFDRKIKQNKNIHVSGETLLFYFIFYSFLSHDPSGEAFIPE
jgi:hypothetical protein